MCLSEPSVEQLVRVASDKRLRVERKLVEKAAGLLGGERVLGIFRGQTCLSPVFVPLVGPLLWVVRPRAVVVTERSVITLQESRFSQSRVVGVVSRYECGSVLVEVSRWGLRIGADEKIYASLATLEDMREVARVASGGASPSSAYHPV